MVSRVGYHVGGGKLKIYGLWGRATLMNHGNPMTVDAVIGDFKVTSSQCLLGIPALCEHDATIRCREGIAKLLDDNGDLRIFGKNRSTVVNP